VNLHKQTAKRGEEIMKAYLKNSMTIGLGFSVAATMLLAGQAFGAQAGISISALPPDAVNTAANGAVIDVSGDYVTIAFSGHRANRSPSSPPPGAEGRIRTSLSTAEGAFTGDYLAAGVQGLAFSLKHTGDTPPRVIVVLEPATGRRWYNTALVNFADADGEWVENNVSFDLAGGWYDARGNRDPAAWDKALQSVASIGLDVLQAGALRQTVSVDNFRLLLPDEVWTPEAVLQERLYSRFGVRDPNQLTAAQRALDSDGDGIPDWKEILFTETDPDGESFDVWVRRKQDGSNEVSWRAAAGKPYRVLVADSPAGPFRPLTGAEHVVASAHGRRAHVDNSDDQGSRFYRVVRLQ
jgi:hypothetical protein